MHIQKLSGEAAANRLTVTPGPVTVGSPWSNRKKRRSLWLRCGSAARCPWRWHHVRISRLGRRLLDCWVHLFRMDDAVRPVQLFAQVLGRRSRIGAGRSLTWNQSVGVGLGVWANAEPATSVTPLISSLSRGSMAIMRS